MKRLTALTYLLLAAGSSIFVGCQNAAELRRQEVRQIAAAHEAYLAELAAIRAEFQTENPMPARLDFGAHGTLLLHECGISGLPGSEKLRVKFTFLNVTGLTIPKAQVTLTLIDEASELEWSEVMKLSLPFGLKMGHNSSYSSLFEMPLNGLHRGRRWDWRIELESERDPLPSSKVSR